ncbi:hypothetical protein CC85DRAFT_318986 [Cutaneotrichosporon oleaginosum]|uniref:Protein CPL1-like domain-containing protein n=1 Tax=Cutaneotrichosporon oleaginosum TaxID=879819 RepID=A0A0J0XM82_9TREE|nr:uncharacterized protein CC85DRAFT_318986 [Cutaneotrichosporon oleaginosum]KLT42235.1 hypothetical protein CC85DRAFT_318986 [Cutaneotrichosporon oleaginosum]TXT11409.1 hypothetical protein COLE_01819 [Cutaneotrichosporon oleaginosum]
MVRLSAIYFIAAFITAFATELVADTTPAPSSPLLETRTRGDLVSGCTCCGYDVSFGSDIKKMKTYYILNWALGKNTKNQGFCFTKGKLQAPYVQAIRNAVESGRDTPSVSAKGARTLCWLMGWNTNAKCVDGIVRGFEHFIVGKDGRTPSMWLRKGCNYPRDNFVPTDCYCGWECLPGFSRSGNQCIPTSQKAPSSVPAPPKRKRSPCTGGAELCPVPAAKGFECIDTESSLEACGACPFQPGSVDCTTLPGVDSVECVQGACRVKSCMRGHMLVDNECRPQ